MAIYESADAVARLMSVEDSDESLDNMNPIFGVNEAPNLSFKDAMQKANVRRKRKKKTPRVVQPSDRKLLSPPARTGRYGVQYRRSPRVRLVPSLCN